MEYTFEYSTQKERENIVRSNTDRYLIAEKNITEGNFLVYTSVKPTEIAIEEAKNTIADLTELVLMGGM